MVGEAWIAPSLLKVYTILFYPVIAANFSRDRIMEGKHSQLNWGKYAYI